MNTKLDVCVSTAQREIHDEIACRFKRIFGMREAPGMLRRLNDLRIEAARWDDEARAFVSVPWVASLLRQLNVLSHEVDRFCYKDLLAVDDDPEVMAHYQKTHHDMCMILYRHAKALGKAERSIPLALLTPGTKIEYFVKHTSTKAPEVVTVAHLSGIDMGRGIVNTVETCMKHGNTYVPPLFPRSVPKTFHSSHVTRVLQHAPGLPKIVNYHESAEYQYAKYDAASKIGKSKNSYATYGSRFLFLAEIERLGLRQDTNQYIDVEHMAQVFHTLHPLNYSEDEDGWTRAPTVFRKKQLKRWIRQNAGRFYLSKKEQTRREEEYHKQIEADLSEDLDYLYADDHE